MKRRDLLKGILLGTGVAAASSVSVAGTSYQFHQRVPRIRRHGPAGGGPDPIMQDALPQDRTGIASTGEVLARDRGVEWYGEVPTSELITGDALAAAFGFNRGQSINNTSPWLHVRLDGRELFIAKRPYRDTLLWTDIHAYSLVKGNRFIDIIDILPSLRATRLRKRIPFTGCHLIAQGAGSCCWRPECTAHWI